jgi:hypothetical protein
MVEAIFGVEEGARFLPSFAPLSASMRISPPAQNPRPSLWSMITASTASSSRHPTSASIIASHIGRLSA